MEPSELPLLPPPIVSIRKGSKFAFMPDGDRLFVAGASRAWMASLSTGALLYEFDKPARFVRPIAVSSDGLVAAMALTCERVLLYDAETGKKTHSLKVGDGADVSGFEFAPTSHALLHSSWRGVTAIDEATQENYSLRPLHTSLPYPDNTMHYAIGVAASGDRFACLWSSHTATHISLFRWPSGDDIIRIQIRSYNSPRQSYVFSQMLFSPDGQSLLWTAPDGSVASQPLNFAAPSESEVVWIKPPIMMDGEQEQRFLIGRLCFSPDGTLLAHRLNNTLRLFAWPSGKCFGKWRLLGKDTMAGQIGFSLTGRELVVYGANPYISVYRVDDLLNTRNTNGN